LIIFFFTITESEEEVLAICSNPIYVSEYPVLSKLSMVSSFAEVDVEVHNAHWKQTHSGQKFFTLPVFVQH